MGQPVLYVTERCVFKLTSEGLELIEVAPGIDIEQNIVALMGFRPIIRSPKAMDASLFNEALMRLDDRLLNRPLSDRLVFDEKRNTLFLGLDGYRVHSLADVEAIRQAVFTTSPGLGTDFPRSSTMTCRTLHPIWPMNGFLWPRRSSELVMIMFRATRPVRSCVSSWAMP